MSAPGRQFKALYHGSDTEFAPGDHVTPQGNWRQAWATTDPKVATAYAENKAAVNGHLFGIVYKVSPLGKTTVGEHPHIRESEEGYKVEGVHSMGPLDRGLRRNS